MKLPRIISSLPAGATAAADGSGQKLPVAPASSAVITPADRPHLILHFDINETILVGDEAGGDTREDCLNKVLAKSAFVLMDDEEEGGEEGQQDAQQEASISCRALSHTKTLKPTNWWDGTSIRPTGSDSKQNAADDDDDEPSPPPPLYIGWQWPPNSCPYYRTSYKKRAKDFTLHDGAPYRPLYYELEKRVAFLPDEIKAPDGHEYPHALHHMLPAFFHTLHELKKEGRSFGLVLRTFGSDLSDIADALNIFAKGQHPLYPNFNDESLILQPSNMFRGRWRQRGNSSGNGNEYEYQLLRWSDNEDDNAVQIAASGDAELLKIIESCSVAGIQDHYEFWDGHDNCPSAGKPVWTHGTSSGGAKDGRRCHHIFFDDNIHNDATDSIAAVRVEKEGSGGRTYRSLSGEEIIEMQGKHLFRVPTVAPILEEDWFLHRIKEAEGRLASE